MLLSWSGGEKLGKMTELTVTSAEHDSSITNSDITGSSTTMTGLASASGTPLVGDGRNAGTTYTVYLKT